MMNLRTGRRSWLIAIGLSMLSVLAPAIVRAQEAPPAPPEPPAPAASLPPEVTEVFVDCNKALREAQAFSADFTGFLTVGEEVQQVSGKVIVNKPNKARVTAVYTGRGAAYETWVGNFTRFAPGKPEIPESLTITGISNGSTSYLTTRPNWGIVRKWKSAADTEAVFQIFNKTADFPLALLSSLMRDTMLKELTGAGGMALKRQPDVEKDGVSLRVVQANVTNSSGGNSDTATLVFSFFKANNLFQGLHAEGTSAGKPAKLELKFTNFQLFPGVPDSTFAFTEPAGAKVIDEDNPEPRRTVTGASPASEAPPLYDKRLTVGAKPLPFSGKDLDGRTQTLAKYRGKVVLLDFWATWCGPCIAELPGVQKAYQKYKQQGLVVIGISLDSDKAALTTFLGKNKMPWPQIFDGLGWESRLAKAYGVRAIPFTLLIGRDGKIAAVNPRGEALEPALQKALAKK